jgi:predicted Holliday junction resolvase-like endonuclease
MNFFKTIFIIVLIYYIVKFFIKLFAPYLLKKAVDKVQKKAEQQYKNQQRETTVEEGKTVVDKTPKNTKQSNNSVGEYVDFEEID